MLPILVSLAGFVLGGCVSLRKSTVLEFPPANATSFTTRDGRLWILESKKEFTFKRTLVFLPQGQRIANWTEMLSFSHSKVGWPTAEIRKLFTVIAIEDDPAMVFELREIGKDLLVATYKTPRWNEVGVQKITRSESGDRMIAYQNRLGPAGASSYRYWRKLIERSELGDFDLPVGTPPNTPNEPQGVSPGPP